ncbi:MAG: ATP-binding protein [Cyanophyceae cyanobacterium]
MVEIFGDFDDSLPPSQEYLHIQFSPSSAPLKQRWRNNGLSADFMGDYSTTFLPRDNDAFDSKREVKSTISFIANELLENAMKFSTEASQYPVSLTLHLLNDKLVFLAKNDISPANQDRLQAFIATLLSSNPEELYTEQVEKSVLSAEQSGLGILTMINDYQAKVGWKFETLQKNPALVAVITMVQLAL